MQALTPGGRMRNIFYHYPRAKDQEKLNQHKCGNHFSLKIIILSKKFDMFLLKWGYLLLSFIITLSLDGKMC